MMLCIPELEKYWDSPNYVKYVKRTIIKTLSLGQSNGEFLDIKDYKRMCVKCHIKYDSQRRNGKEIVRKGEKMKKLIIGFWQELF